MKFLGEGKNEASLKQIQAALSFAYRHLDLKNPFSKIDPPILHAFEAQLAIVSAKRAKMQ